MWVLPARLLIWPGSLAIPQGTAMSRTACGHASAPARPSLCHPRLGGRPCLRSLRGGAGSRACEGACSRPADGSLPPPFRARGRAVEGSPHSATFRGLLQQEWARAHGWPTVADFLLPGPRSRIVCRQECADKGGFLERSGGSSRSRELELRPRARV